MTFGNIIANHIRPTLGTATIQSAKDNFELSVLPSAKKHNPSNIIGNSAITKLKKKGSTGYAHNIKRNNKAQEQAGWYKIQ